MASEKKEKKPASKKMRIFKKVLLSIAIVFGAILVGGFIYIATLPEWHTFDPDKIINIDQTIQIYDKNDTLVGNVYGKENRIKTSIENIPEHVKNAVIAIEDVRFYQHNGIDFRRLVGAILADIKAGSLKEGGSTISQQLIKMSHLTNEKTFTRKIKEAVLAIQLERNFEKDEILEMYLNYAYFGNGAYGIETAAQAYFGKSVSELSIAQGAMLAGILKSPTNYAPHTNLEQSIERRNLVLSQMEKYSFITSEQAQEAKQEEVVLSEKEEAYPYGYYTDMVLTEAAEKLNISVDEVQSGGYSIYTSMDTQLQETIENLNTQSELFPADAADGTQCESAVVVLSPDKNEIVALTGGRTHSSRRVFNRATQLYRQPGSTIKPPLVFAPALETGGYTSTSILYDAPEDFNGYSPSNFGGTYYGYVTLKDVVAKSLNVPAVKILEDIGVKTGQAYAEQVGIEFEEQDNNLAIALGGFTNGVTPLQLAGSYAPFANGGTYTQPTCIRKIIGPDGKTVYENAYESQQVLSEENAYIMTDMMELTASTGTARRLNSVGIPIAAKTGTTGIQGKSENKDAWVVSYNPEYTVCVWMGFDNTDEEHCLAQSVTGGTLPTELAATILKYLYPDSSGPDFKVPDSVVQVKLDGSVLKTNNELVLANANTNTESIQTEYFSRQSLYSLGKIDWLNPLAPVEVSVLPAANNGAVIVFDATDVNANYQVYRKDTLSGQPQLLGEYPGGKEVRVWDNQPVSSSAVYYVVATRPSVIINGKAVESEPSAQILYTPNQGTQTLPTPSPSTQPENKIPTPSLLEETPEATPEPEPSIAPPLPSPSASPMATPRPTSTTAFPRSPLQPSQSKRPSTTINWPLATPSGKWQSRVLRI